MYHVSTAGYAAHHPPHFHVPGCLSMSTKVSNVAAAPQAQSSSERSRALRQRQQAWVQSILDRHNLNYTQLAKRCGFDRTTLTRLFSADSQHLLRSDTIDKITAVFGPMDGAAAPPALAPAVKSRGFVEASPVAANDDVALEAIVAAIQGGRSACNPFELKSDHLTQLGYLRGDILFVDQNAAASDGDLVCVQLYNWDGTSAGTVFQVLQGDYLLLPAQRIGEAPPAPISRVGANLAIMGPVTDMVRPRRLSRAPMHSDA